MIFFADKVWPQITKFARISYCPISWTKKVISCKRHFNHHIIGRSTRAESRMSVDVFRQKKLYKAVVQDIFHASTMIKIVRLSVKGSDFNFKSGQWVDFYIPGVEEVTGYSMTSGPYKVKQNGTFDLAVKYAKYTPTHWIHKECTKGSEIDVQVGGDFQYDPQEGTPEASADLLLIGGGVGVNPLVSILSQYCHLKETEAVPGQAKLLYSSKTEAELIFKDTLTAMEKSNPSLNCQYFVTKPNYIASDPKVKCRRIGEDDMSECLASLQENNTLCYVCGPSNMTDDAVKILLKLGVEDSYIKYEKWW